MSTVQSTGAVAGYRPERTLRLSVELRRQFKRRRTIGVFALMVALPLLLIAALQLGASEDAQSNSRLNLVDVATSSGLNFTLFVLFATTSFFLVVVYALFFGDTVASEAQWGSLRYALATPVPRMRLLRQKWLAALVMSVAALLTVTVVAVVAADDALSVIQPFSMAILRANASGSVSIVWRCNSISRCLIAHSIG